MAKKVIGGVKKHGNWPFYVILQSKHYINSYRRMAETLLNKISKHPNSTYITDAWLTGQTGEIVDLKGDCIFRFVDYDTEGELRIKHTTKESQLSCIKNLVTERQIIAQPPLNDCLCRCKVLADSLLYK